MRTSAISAKAFPPHRGEEEKRRKRRKRRE